MAEKNIHAPLMVVRGDGSLISEKSRGTGRSKTVLSGPAGKRDRRMLAHRPE